MSTNNVPGITGKYIENNNNNNNINKRPKEKQTNACIVDRNNGDIYALADNFQYRG